MATIKGKWIFDEILEDFNAYYSVDGTQVNFVSNDTQYTGFSSQQSFGDDAMQQNMAYAQSGNVSIGVYSFLTSSWIVDVAYRTVDFGTTEQSVSDEFLTWMQANAKPEAEPAPTDAVTIEYNGSVIASLKAGQSATLECKDLPMLDSVVVSVPDGMGAGEVVEEWDGSYTVSGGEEAVLGDITITAVGKAHQYSVYDGSGAFVSEGTIASGSSVHLTNIESGGSVNLINGNVVWFSNAVNCSYDTGGNITNIGVGASITATYSDR